MLISRDSIGREPLLPRAALDRIFAAPGLEVTAQPRDAVVRTLTDLTTDSLHRTYDVILPRKELESAAKTFGMFRCFVEGHPTLFYSMPEPPKGYFEAQARWFATELKAVGEWEPGQGRVLNRFHAYSVPRLLALYAIAFRREPAPGNPTREGPAARFLRQYSSESVGELERAQFNTDVEREHFLRAWNFPASLVSLMRRHGLRPEPEGDSATVPGAPTWLGARMLGAWGHVAQAFRENGGLDPYRPKQARGAE